LAAFQAALCFCSTAEKHFRAATAGAMLTSVPGAVRRRPCGSFAPSAINHNPTVRSMMTRKKPREDWIARDLPVVAELKQCRRLAKDHWQGVDVDGTILDIIEAEEGLSPAIDACLPAAGVFPTIARER
jgi:hypothetical protein